MHILGSVEPDPRMAMLGVVPAEEGATEHPSIFDASKAVWKLRSVLEGFKLAFRERIVIRH